jgi:hypothetical protein
VIFLFQGAAGGMLESLFRLGNYLFEVLFEPGQNKARPLGLNLRRQCVAAPGVGLELAQAAKSVVSSVVEAAFQGLIKDG